MTSRPEQPKDVNVDINDDDDVEAGKTSPDSAKSDFTPTDPDNGLSSKEVAMAMEIYGPNEIPVPSTPLIVLFLRQFVGFLPLLIEIVSV